LLIHYLRLAARNLRRRQGHELVNLAGLTLGVTASILIFRYAAHETSYDAFHANVDHIYRLTFERQRDAQPAVRTATIFSAVGPALESSFPEVLSSARITRRYGGGTVRFQDRYFRENAVFHADPSLLRMFSFPVVRGDPESALEDPNTAVISTRAAQRYFGSENPVGKIIQFGDQESYSITAVVEVPSNSHIQFDFLFSYNTLARLWEMDLATDWGSLDFVTYVLLSPGAEPSRLEAALPGFLSAHRSARADERTSMSMQPVRSIHLESDLLFELSPNGDSDLVATLGIIGVIILVVAWVNYVNLVTARSAERARETGIRKCVGAYRTQLVGQFVFEAVLTSSAVTLLALLFAGSLETPLGRLVGREFGRDIWDPVLFWTLVGTAVTAGTIAASFYPAAILSSFRPIDVLKGRFVTSGRGSRLRKTLVTVQFASTIALIAGTIVVYKQLAFMRNQDLGIDIDDIVVVDAPGLVMNNSSYASRFESFKEDVVRNPWFESVSVSSEVPGSQDPWLNYATVIGGARESRTSIYVVSVDPDYLGQYRHRLTAGRYLRRESAHDSSAVVINERAVALVGFAAPTEAVGERLVVRDDTLEIVGIVADHHQQGLQEAKYQMAFRIVPSEYRYFSIRLANRAPVHAIDYMEDIFREHFPDTPFDHRPLTQLFSAQYEADRRFGLVVKIFASLSILIACLGLFGLASLSAQQRTRDIGIRKIFGASVEELVLLLNRDYAVLLLVAGVVAAPLAHLASQRWLEGFAYRVVPGVVPIAAAVVLTALLVFLTVSYHSIRAARANTVDSLRCD